ncbi:zeaxanthin epoxidase, chloroplastic isoform X1 [Cryptomeria japonica]|uniref:zeaxanthin epoxidase, chloroplastic isoform X1 n=1 Tax=Cryptomeria japonica TaxID=3369 RepID=UPI0027DAB423|nr:zeaxanthin epoxidase, chloroplastic isoform X1 [Cryptomeria japonica]
MSSLEFDEMAVSERGPDLDIVIAGGGLAGLSLALALQHRNVEAHVFEYHPYFKADTATAIGIGPNGVTALEGIKPGLSSIISQAGSYTNNIKLTYFRDGKEDPPRITNVPPKKYITVRWKSVQEILASLVDNKRIVFSHKLIGYRPSKGGVEAYFRCGNALDRIKVVWTKLLIGADGIWSAVRKQMVGDSPRYLNLVHWNALLYNPDLNRVYKGIKEGEIIARTMENMQAHSIIAHAGDYTLWVLRTKDESEDLANSLVGGRGGIGIPGCKARALKQLDGLEGWESVREVIDATSEDIISERKIMDRLPLDKWTDADGHVLLIGDAAHAQYVGPGQGARTAFEDAHQLSLLLQHASHSSFTEESIRDAVKRFEEVRIPRMKKMQQFAAYSTRLPKFQPEWFQNLTMEERLRVHEEYTKWVYSYPNKQECDPDSIFFK